MKLLYLAPAASFQILVVVATLVRSEVQVTDSTEKELLAEIKSVPVRIYCFCSLYSISKSPICFTENEACVMKLRPSRSL